MMRCRDRRRIYRWLDGALRGDEAQAFEIHLKQCPLCQQELESTRAFHDLLKWAPAAIEPSETFEAAFWKNAYAREREPWLTKILRDLESIMPAPNFAQAWVAILIAVLIGGGGGIFSALRTWGPAHLGAGQISIKYLSGFQEFKGIPESSITVSYMKASVERK